MKAGQTAYKTVDGVRYQCALFPLDYLYCTQVAGSGSYSHCCGTATDWVGRTSNYPYYAPVDCRRVSLGGSDNIARYVSDRVVLTPSGPKYIAFLFMHDDNPPSKTTFKQGEVIGHTGTAGFVTGDHVHLDECFGQSIVLTTDGTVCPAGNTCYYVENGVRPTQMFFITDEDTLANLEGQNFTKLTDYVPGEGGSSAPNLLWMAVGLSTGKKSYLKIGKG